MPSEVDKLLKKHRELVHSDMLKVMTPVQREEDEWIVNILTLEGYDVLFTYKRKKRCHLLMVAMLTATANRNGTSPSAA